MLSFFPFQLILHFTDSMAAMVWLTSLIISWPDFISVDRLWTFYNLPKITVKNVLSYLWRVVPATASLSVCLFLSLTHTSTCARIRRHSGTFLQHRLVFPCMSYCSKIRCWGWYLGLKETRLQGSGEDYITRSFMLCTSHQILFEWSNKKGRDGQGI